MSRRYVWALGCVAVLTAAGYLMPFPAKSAILAPAARLAEIGVWAAPVVPLGLWLLLLTPYRLPNIVAAVFAVMVTVMGLALSTLVAAFSGAGSLIALVHGLSLTAAVTGWMFLARQTGGGWVSRGLAATGALVGMWSLASAGVVAVQAASLADDRAYCLAHHTTGESPVSSFADLRGLSFYTTQSGYKTTSHWFFHGVLLIDANDFQEVWTWSHSNMRFDRLERPKDFAASPLGACTPSENFLSKLPLV